MIRPIQLAFFLFLLPFLAKAQAHRDTTFLEDVNHDSRLDTIHKVYDSGSGFGGETITITDGKSGKVYEFGYTGCFCDQLVTEPIPKNLQGRAAAPFRDKIKKELFSEPCGQPGPMFQHLLEMRQTQTQLKNHPHFSSAYQTSGNWQKEPLFQQDEEDRFAGSCFLELPGGDFHRVFRTYGGIPEDYDSLHTPGWVLFSSYSTLNSLVYFPGKKKSKNPKTFGKYTLKTFPHAIEVEAGGKRKWGFVTNYAVTGGAEKMRWPSIDSVLVWKDMLIVPVNHAPLMFHTYWAVDLESGKAAELRVPDLDRPTVRLEGTKLLFEGGEESGELDLEEIKSALKQLKIKP